MLHKETRLKDRYEIESVLGRGGMGQVYLAIDRALGGKKVAVKEMTVRHLTDHEREEGFACFRQEAHLLASLDHPRLVPVTDFFEEGSTAFLVMGLVEGETLEAVLRARPVSQREVLDWVDQICEVLIYLHGHDPPVLFHDLKPSNVMLDNRDRIRLIDFGIARTLEGHKTRAFPQGAGTAEFSPLEQLADGATDPRSDLYALGATMYALLTRKAPPVSIEVMFGDAAPPAPRALNPDISPEVEDVILTAMALDRHARYRSALDMRSALSVARHAAVSRQRPSEELQLVPRRTDDPPYPAASPATFDSVGSLATFSEVDDSGERAPALPSATLSQRSIWRRLRLGRVACALLLALVLGWGLAGLLGGRAPLRQHALMLASVPPGASVRVDEQPAGLAPVVVCELTEGTHVARFEMKGMESAEVTFTFHAGTATQVDLVEPDESAVVRAASAPELRVTLVRRP